MKGPMYVQKSLGVLGVLGVFSSIINFLSTPTAASIKLVFDFFFFFSVNVDGDDGVVTPAVVLVDDEVVAVGVDDDIF